MRRMLLRTMNESILLKYYDALKHLATPPDIVTDSSILRMYLVPNTPHEA